MTKKMLIDASHPEETRVVVVDHSRVEELDFESQAKRQLRGNVYLARVTRVEPSLQAAFVEFGGNRHGFLAFSEIHPDYYQIPFEDRQALIAAEEADNRQDDEDEDEDAPTQSGAIDLSKVAETDDTPDPLKAAAGTFRTALNRKVRDLDDPTAPASKNFKAAEKEFEIGEGARAAQIVLAGAPALIIDDTPVNDNDDDDDIEDDAADDDDKEVAAEQKNMDKKRRQRMSRRRYKIQEVIKRGQILLVQAVKEERGNKGAAVTTYLSLAGRYCVLMPNTPRGGGISRKISNGSDRKHLKAIMSDLEVPQGMGVIVRTAGAKRTKAEIQHDYDYLARLWDTIRTNTMNSVAPALIHQEGDLVKRSLRDLYNKDIDEVLVQGEGAHKDAKAFIEMLMPSHAKNVKLYDDDIPLFLRYQVESQIEASLDPVAQLPSGGYLVIHPTEALVSVDVNSGRSTKERNVERTALKTNLEAAEEVARQMRLRDLAGLVVIDFIDMDENRNNRAVEKRMKDALARDRARVQMGRISQFGLMEISRQRRRRSLLEGSSASCEHCGGVGRKRSVESSALLAVRAIEEEGVRGIAKRIRLRVSPGVALYLFNEKRDLLQRVDAEFNVFTELVSDDKLHRPSFEIERVELHEDAGKDPLAPLEKAAKADLKRRPKRPQTHNNAPDSNDGDEDGESSPGGKKNKRRRGGRNKSRNTENQNEKSQNDESDSEDASSESKPQARETGENGEPRKRRRRRGRRGGRTKRDDTAQSETEASGNAADDVKNDAKSNGEDKAPDSNTTSDKPARKPRKRKPATAASENNHPEASVEDKGEAKKTTRKPRAKKAAPKAEKAEASTSETPKATSKRVRQTAPAPKTEAETEKPKRVRKTAPKKDAKVSSEKPATPTAKTKAPAPKRVRKAAPKKDELARKAPEKQAPASDPAPKPNAEAKPEAKPAPDKKAKSEKKGWWSKRNPFA